MITNINEAVAKIKKVGTLNTRIVPDGGTGSHRIEVKEDGTWVQVASGLTKQLAEDLVSKAANKVILG